MSNSSEGGDRSDVQQSSGGNTGLPSGSVGNNDSQKMDQEKLQKTLQLLEGLIPDKCIKSAKSFIERICNNPTNPQQEAENFIIDLKEQLESDKGKKRSSRLRGKVKVYSKVTGKTFGADPVLLDKVKSMSQSVTLETTRDLQESDIVIAFCPITSRVGSDVEAAMTDITASCGKKPVILVLMHHTRDVEYSTEGRRWSDVYPSVVLDVHVLFHETKNGLLLCPKNDQAAAQILRELEKHKEMQKGSGPKSMSVVGRWVLVLLSSFCAGLVSGHWLSVWRWSSIETYGSCPAAWYFHHETFGDFLIYC
ncbi:uncharacterized protein LOC121907569 [Scomber scombrus]|uniref:Uncharacterized protein LOC121907569 n=1 Tax=Scomber scombrus TaxID=13677 RepID=A0AAV1PTR6_SCOSC